MWRSAATAPPGQGCAVLVRRLRDAGPPPPDACAGLDGAVEAREVLQRHAELARRARARPDGR